MNKGQAADNAGKVEVNSSSRMVLHKIKSISVLGWQGSGSFFAFCALNW